MRKIGRYIVRGLLGKGGMGKVYKVELPPIGRIAALKLLDPDPLVVKLMGERSLQAMFTGEAGIMAGLQHPNIVAIHDFDWHDGRPFYVMDFFANNVGAMIGETYRTEQPSRKIRIDKALDYTRQTLEGLWRLHEAGIVHRDIKPYNLLVTAWDVVKICDFGLSKLRGETYAGPANLNVGSPYYAAPEQEADPDSAGVAADLYPVGVILYRMISGRLPRDSAQNETVTPLSRLCPDVDDQWDAFVSRALSIAPEQRFDSARQMLAALGTLETSWRRKKEKTCALPDLDAHNAGDGATAARPRSEPVKVYPPAAVDRFDLNALWRPARYIENRFEASAGDTVRDHATGLRWQQSGTAFPGTWQQARNYIHALNREALAGVTTWRLPTIDELMTLLAPVPTARDLCIAPIFDPRQRRLWSSDRRSYIAAYYVDIELGFVGWQDFSAPFHVRAVSTDKP